MDDLISRQAAIDLFPNDALEWDTKDGYIAPHLAKRMIEELPSAQLERKTGKWIRVIDGFECSNCECLVEEEREPLYDFCPHCGTDMRGKK